MRKLKLLFVNGSECKSPICSATEFLSLYQYRTSASFCLGIVLESSAISVQQRRYTVHCNDFRQPHVLNVARKSLGRGPPPPPRLYYVWIGTKLVAVVNIWSVRSAEKAATVCPTDDIGKGLN